MRLRAAFPALAVALAPTAMHAVIVDRVAVAVGNKVITQSEIELRIRLTAFQNNARPDFTLASRKEAAQRLIDQKLVEREMDVGHFPRTTPEHGQELLADYSKSHFPGGEASLFDALKADGLTGADLETDLMHQTDLLTFLNLRFRPVVQVDDRDVQKYFDDKVAPGSAKDAQGIAGMRGQIEGLLATQRADKDLDDWFKDQRRRLRIDYIERDLDPAGTAAP